MEVINNDIKLGFHVSKFPSLEYSVKNIIDNRPYNAIQIYLTNSRSYSEANVSTNDLIETKKLLEFYDMYMCVHGCILYNLCGSAEKNDPKFEFKLNRTRKYLISELDICSFLGIGVVVHPNSYPILEKGLQIIGETITYVLTKPTSRSKLYSKILNISEKDFIKRRRIILENCAGEGKKTGKNLDELRCMIDYSNSEIKDQIKICIDTAHAFGAGEYDWGIEEEIDRFYQEFEEKIGLDHLELFHLNDSSFEKKAYFGSKKDRHENLCQGYIFSGEERTSSLKKFFIEAFKRKIPIIGEPPKSGMMDWVIALNLCKDTEYPIILN